MSDIRKIYRVDPILKSRNTHNNKPSNEQNINLIKKSNKEYTDKSFKDLYEEMLKAKYDEQEER